MSYDDERGRQKASEVTSVAKDAISRHWQALGLSATDTEAQAVATEIIAAFVENTPPEPEPAIFRLMTMSSGGRQGGSSRKPGNLLLNMRTLVGTLSKAVLSAKAVAAAPWTAPFAALVIWDSVWAGMSVDLNERDATVMWTMWSTRDDDNCVSHATLLKAVNAELAKYGRPPLVATDLVGSLDRLRKLKAIEKKRKDGGQWWWLREWVSADYQ